MEFTNEQKNALAAKGRVLVSAAAGSGKTAVLVEKVINLICDEKNPVDIDNILVVTFTNAAANEMKSRISKSLSQKISENPNSFHLKKQKLLLSSAAIGTIDSICINIAREHFYKLGISCDFKIADKSALQKLKSNCLDEVLAENFEKEDETFLNLLSIFGEKLPDEELKQNILKLYEYFSSLPFPSDYIDKVLAIYKNFDENSILLKTVFDYTYELVSSSYVTFMSGYDKLREDSLLLSGYGDAFSKTAEKFRKILLFIDKRDYKSIKEMLDVYKNESLTGVKNYTDTEFKEKIQKYKKNAEKTFAKLKRIFNCDYEDILNDIQALLPIIEKFFDVTMEFSKKFYSAKLENNIFDFSDIESEVLKFLVNRENGKIFYTEEAKELSNKYKYVFVDEYQDTNDLQNTIFNALSDEGKNLFMVGDVKQSIYRFRKANPRNFLKERNSLPNYGLDETKSKVIMSGNFRSSEDVCDFVNFMFYRLLSEKCGEMFYEDEDKLDAKAKYLPVNSKRVCLDIITEKTKEEKNSELQALHIANIIKEKTNGEAIITDGDELRPAKYSDICILLRGRDEMPVFVEVFKKLGIPVATDDNEGLLKEKEIVTLFSLLQTIDNPSFPIPLLATLTGDIYNFSAQEVASIRAKNKNIDLYQALLKEKSNNEKVANFLDEINKFRKVAATSSVFSLISNVLNKTGYENIVYLYENGEICYQNLLLFKQVAKTFEETGQRGLSAFVSYIKRQIKNDNTLQKTALISDNNDAVKIMTMHGSKGLQFPICILACLEKKFKRVDAKVNVLLTEECGLGFNYVDQNRGIKYSTFPRNAAVIENNAFSQSEEMRLLYVAMTRAKDFLIMVGSREKLDEYINSISDELLTDTNLRFNPSFVQNCTNFLEMLIAGALVHKNGEELRDFAKEKAFCNSKGDIQVNIVETVERPKETENQTEQTEELDETRFNEICECLNIAYPYKDLNKIFVKQSASGLAHKEIAYEYAFSAQPLFMQKSKLTAAQKGTAMHKFMQYCDFVSASKNISEEVERLTLDGKLTTAEAESINEENLNAFFCSEIGKKVVNAKKVYKEQGFMVELPAKTVHKNLGEEFDNEKIIIQGNADLCFFDEKGLFIIDYKTDKANTEELISRYKPQLEIYALALAQTFDTNISGTAIYSFYNKELIIL